MRPAPRSGSTCRPPTNHDRPADSRVRSPTFPRSPTPSAQASRVFLVFLAPSPTGPGRPTCGPRRHLPLRPPRPDPGFREPALPSAAGSFWLPVFAAEHAHHAALALRIRLCVPASACPGRACLPPFAVGRTIHASRKHHSALIYRKCEFLYGLPNIYVEDSGLGEYLGDYSAPNAPQNPNAPRSFTRPEY